MVFLGLRYGFLTINKYMCKFIPNKTCLKYKRYHRAHLRSTITKFINFPFFKSGVLGLKIVNFGFLLPKQLKSMYFTLNKILKKKAVFFIFAFPRSSLTSKPIGARMGKGKGKQLSNWVFRVTAGFILCEIHTRFIKLAIAALQIVKKKLPLPSKIIFNFK